MSSDAEAQEDHRREHGRVEVRHPVAPAVGPAACSASKDVPSSGPSGPSAGFRGRPAEPVAMTLLQDFKKFLFRGNLVELAVAFVMGAAFATLMKSLVGDLITPIIAARQDQIRAVMTDSSSGRFQKARKMKSIMSDSDKKIESLLTSDQQAGYRQFEQERRDEMRSRMQ